ncbi:MAG: fimbria/pilus periplasmic chaperone [Deltaproteobacteria bacterium]
MTIIGNRCRSLAAVLTAVVMLTFLFSGWAQAGTFKVSPIRIDLDKDTKSGFVTVVNDGAERINTQIKLFEWTQDADGKDVYTESNDLIYFPRIMTINAGEERILRVGLKAPAIAKEKTYRVFIEEIPQPKKAPGAQVAIAIRFGVPIFVKPVKEEPKGALVGLELSGGVLKVPVRNEGNTHFTITAISVKGANVKGEEVFSRDLTGWYLLGGSSRLYSAQIGDACKDIAALTVEVQTNKFNLTGNINVNEAMCRP